MTCHCQADLTLLVQCFTGSHLHRTELFGQFPNYWTASRLKSLSTLVTPLATWQQSKAIATAATTDARHNDSSSIGDCRRHCGSSWAFELLPPVGNCHHQLSWKIWTAAVHWLPGLRLVRGKYISTISTNTVSQLNKCYTPLTDHTCSSALFSLPSSRTPNLNFAALLKKNELSTVSCLVCTFSNLIKWNKAALRLLCSARGFCSTYSSWLVILVIVVMLLMLGFAGGVYSTNSSRLLNQDSAPTAYCSFQLELIRFVGFHM